MANSWKIALAFALAASTAAPALADGEVNIYSYRQPDLIKPLLDRFTQETGIATNVLFLDKGLVERIQAELQPPDYRSRTKLQPFCQQLAQIFHLWPLAEANDVEVHAVGPLEKPRVELEAGPVHGPLERPRGADVRRFRAQRLQHSAQG